MRRLLPTCAFGLSWLLANTPANAAPLTLERLREMGAQKAIALAIERTLGPSPEAVPDGPYPDPDEPWADGVTFFGKPHAVLSLCEVQGVHLEPQELETYAPPSGPREPIKMGPIEAGLYFYANPYVNVRGEPLSKEVEPKARAYCGGPIKGHVVFRGDIASSAGDAIDVLRQIRDAARAGPVDFKVELGGCVHPSECNTEAEHRAQLAHLASLDISRIRAARMIELPDGFAYQFELGYDVEFGSMLMVTFPRTFPMKIIEVEMFDIPPLP